MKMYLPCGFKFHDNITVTEASVFIPEIWANAVLKTIFQKSAMIGAVSSDYKDELGGVGDVVHVQKRGSLHSHEKVANQTVTLQTPSGSTFPVTLTNHKEVSFLVEDLPEAQATPSLIAGYTEDAANVLAVDIEDALCSIYAAARFTPANDLEWDASDDDTKLASLIALRTAMVVDAKLPESSPRYVVIKDLKDILTVDKFTSKEFLDQNTLETGQVGAILGFNIKESSQIVTTLSPTQVHRLAFAKEAITLVTRRLPDPPQGSGVKGTTVVADGVGMRAISGYNLDYLGLQVTVDILYGCEIIRPEWVFELLDA